MTGPFYRATGSSGYASYQNFWLNHDKRRGVAFQSSVRYRTKSKRKCQKSRNLSVSERAQRMRRPLDATTPVPQTPDALATLLVELGVSILKTLCQLEVLTVYRLAIVESDHAPETARTLDDPAVNAGARGATRTRNRGPRPRCNGDVDGLASSSRMSAETGTVRHPKIGVPSFAVSRLKPVFRPLHQAPSAINDDHGSGAEAFAHEIKVRFCQIFRLTDATDG